MLSTNQGNQGSGDIAVNASESLSMRGVGIYGFTQNLLLTDTITGVGANLAIAAPRLLIEDGGKINTHTFGSGMAGNVSVAADSIQISGFSALKPATTRSWIVSETAGAGRAGDVQVTTRQLRMEEGGSLSSASATVLPLAIQQAYGLPPLPTGNSGDLLLAVVLSPRDEVVCHKIPPRK